MLRLCLLFVSGIGADQPGECTLENTIRDANTSMCVCLPGYMTDPDAFKLVGCWKCKTQCHPMAECIHPGECRCRPEYIGDGVTKCTIPLPSVNGITSRSVTQKGVSVVTFSFSKDEEYEPKQVFCQMGLTILEAVKVKRSDGKRGYATFHLPKTLHGRFSVPLSFDSFHWSTETVEVVVESETNIDEVRKSMPFLIGLTSAVFLLICLNYGQSIFFTMPESPSDEEALFDD